MNVDKKCKRLVTQHQITFVRPFIGNYSLQLFAKCQKLYLFLPIASFPSISSRYQTFFRGRSLVPTLLISAKCS